MQYYTSQYLGFAIFLRSSGDLINLSRVFTMALNLGLWDRSFCQQSNISWWIASGQSCKAKYWFISLTSKPVLLLFCTIYVSKIWWKQNLQLHIIQGFSFASVMCCIPIEYGHLTQLLEVCTLMSSQNFANNRAQAVEATKTPASNFGTFLNGVVKTLI